MRARLKGARRAMRLEAHIVLTEEDKAILRQYDDVIDCSLTEPWEDRDTLDYYGLLHGMTEWYLEVTRPNDEYVRRSALEKWRIADTTIANMWAVLRPEVLDLLADKGWRDGQGSDRERAGDRRQSDGGAAQL